MGRTGPELKPRDGGGCRCFVVVYCCRVAGEGGKRVLVARVWPRGLRDEDAHLDECLRYVAPSTELRKWYSHEPGRSPEFRRRYRAELRDAGHREAAGHLRDLAARDRLTLLTATKDVDHSQAAV